MQHPKVGIVIVNYNCWDYTVQCLESLLDLDYSNFQAIVVDNCSTDGSLDKIKSWADGGKIPYPQLESDGKILIQSAGGDVCHILYSQCIAQNGGDAELEKKLQDCLSLNSQTGSQYPLILIESDKNTGFGGGNNIGIRYILAKQDFDYILLLNNDTVIDKDFLQKLIEIAQSLIEKSIGIIGPEILKPDGTPQISFWKFHSYFSVFNRELLFGHFFKTLSASRFRKVDVICGACMLFRKTVFEEVGLFDENYFLYSEESDICYRARKRGYITVQCSGCNVIHFGGQSARSRSRVAVLNSYKSKIYFFHKHYGRFKAMVLEKILITGLYERIFLLTFINLISENPTWTQYLQSLKEVVNWYKKNRL